MVKQATCNEPISGTDPTSVTADLTNLEPDTTYHLRLTISNAGGSGSKEASTFTTLPVEPPTVLRIDDATNVEYSQAVLTGEVERPANSDPAFDAQCRFEYVGTLDSEPRGDTQRLTVSATGGTYRIADTRDLGGGNVITDTTPPIAFDATAAAVQSAIETLPRVGSGNVSVSGGPGDEVGENPYTIVFIGALGNKDVAQLSADSAGLTLAGESSVQIQTIAEGHGNEGFQRASTIPCEPETITNPDPSGTESIKATVSAKPAGLAPGTTYRYRLVASNAAGSDSKEALNTFTTLVPGAPAVSIVAPTDVTATSAHLAGTIDPAGTDPGFTVNWHFRCVPKCPGEGSAGTIEADEATHEVTFDPTGLRSNVTYTVTLIATNAAAKVIAGPEQFKTIAVGPVVTTFPAFALAGGTKALVGGEVDAENSATKYWIDYGSDANYGASIPLSQEGDAGSGEDPNFVTEEISGLQPGTTYHFRLMASNSVGVAEGADKAFTTRPAGGLGSSIGGNQLPDDRHWEMVSPPAKNGFDVWKVKAQASASGDAFAFESQGSFAGQPTSKSGALTDYLSKRGASSWSTQGIYPPGGFFDFNEPGYHEFSEELDFGRLRRVEFANESLDPELELDPDAKNTPERFYVRDMATGAYRIVPDGYKAASDDFKHMALEVNAELTPDGCSVLCVYEQFGKELRLASKLPDGNIEYGQFAAISKDGSRLFWTSIFGNNLFARIDGTSTVQIDESERTAPPVGEGGGATVAGLGAPSGEQVLFVTGRELVDGDEDSANDLYVWDATKPEGQRLTLVSQGDTPGLEAEFGGVLGSDGDRVTNQSAERGYFTASNQIVSGESSAAGQKVYFWNAGVGQPTLRYVATLANGIVLQLPEPRFPGDLNPGRADPNIHTSPNGNYLAFGSAERLTAYDNQGKREIYLYDGKAGQLTCVSCHPAARPATAPAAFNTVGSFESANRMRHIPRNVSDGGQVFFETAQSLAPLDSNGQRDVYEYSGGLPHLLSAGTGPGESRFLDASASGDDVFFATADQLVGWDLGKEFDVYDARVGGGLPEPPPPVIGCDGDSCQPPPTPPNDPTPASANFNGAGNVKEKGTGKKKHKKHKKHKKRKHKKQHATKRHASATHENG